MEFEKTMPGNKLQTILLVDDEQIVVEPIGQLLKKIGYSVLTATSGEQAVELVKQNGHDIDIVILDMLMPGMNGNEALAYIRRDRPNLPVLMASGYHYPDQLEQIIRDGCKGFIKKPYTISELHSEIQKCLR